MSEPERLLRRPRDGMIAGVCTAFARTFGLDVTLIRLAWVLSILLAGTGLLAYVICWIVIPRE